MNKELQLKVQSLVDSATLNQEEAEQILSNANKPEANLAADQIGSKVSKDGGYTTQFISDAVGNFNMRAPLMQDFMAVQPGVMGAETLTMTYYLMKYLANVRVKPGECPKPVTSTTRSVTAKFGKYWDFDEFLKEELIIRYNQKQMNPQYLAGDTAALDPIMIGKKRLMSTLIQSFEQDAWNARADNEGFGIIGLKTQHMLQNTVIPAAGAQNGRYNNVAYTNDAAGRQAFAANIAGRITKTVNEFGANHFTLYVPNGSGAAIKQALFAYYDIIPFIRQGGINTITEAGSMLSGQAGMDGRIYVNENLDIKEITGPNTGEAYLYCDTLYGDWMYRTYEFGVYNRPPSGVRMYVSDLNKEMSDITGLSENEFIEACMCGSDSRCEVMKISAQWTGQIIAPAVGFSCLYSNVGFITPADLVDVSDSGETNVNLSVPV